MTEFKSGEIRDRLANERTLLAWIRTALAFIALGLGLAKLALFMEAAGPTPTPGHHLPDPKISFFVGAALVGMGGAISLVGAWRSYIWSHAIDPAHKGPENISLAVIAGLTSLMSAGLLIYLITS
jgi:putative membrane protein